MTRLQALELANHVNTFHYAHACIVVQGGRDYIVSVFMLESGHHYYLESEEGYRLMAITEHDVYLPQFPIHD